MALLYTLYTACMYIADEDTLLDSPSEDLETVVVMAVTDVEPSTTHSTVRQKRRRRPSNLISNVLVFSLLTLLVMFFFGTPLTLVLTVPAYVLADKVQCLAIRHTACMNAATILILLHACMNLNFFCKSKIFDN